MPLELSAALMMAAGRNPQVAFAQERIREAYARHQRAEVLWLPSLQAGVTYDHHEGTIQEVSGPVFDVSRSSAYSGLGARAIGAGNPAFPGLSARFAFTDAIHQPEITAWQTDARSHASEATRNQVLLDTALAYLDLLEAHQQNAMALETLANAGQLAELTESFAKAGEGLRADADRAATELTVRKNAVLQTEEAIQVASARLAQQLSLDPTAMIFPTEIALIPMDLMACELTLQDLVSQGLESRPELAENTALVQAAIQELERVRQAPLLPSVLLGMSYGGFGGGVGDTITNYRDRFDFEATAFWEVRNLGFGEKAARHESQSQQQQAQIRQVRLMDQVAREVVEAQSQVQSRRRQIDTARQGIETASNSYRRNLERIQDGQGLPIEVLQSLQALDAARREYLRAVVSYNEAQFRLQWAIGWPVN
jgi:outer membrane protein TolC